MSSAEHIRSFWQTKAASPQVSPRTRQGPTMANLVTTQERKRALEQRMSGEAMTPRTIDLPEKLVANSPFTQSDKSSPQTSPREEQTPSFREQRRNALSPPDLGRSRSSSPIKSALADSQMQRQELARSKSVTFNEALEVRHMSDCSFDTGSSPFSTRAGREYDSDLDESTDEEERPQAWRMGSTSTAAGPLRSLPAIPVAARPLPTLPTSQRTEMPEQRVLASEQEASRHPYPGLGLHLQNASHVEIGKAFDADHVQIRRPLERNSIELSDQEEGAVQSYKVEDLSESASSTPAVSPLPPSQSPFVSQEPISRESIRSKIAQRKAMGLAGSPEKTKFMPALVPHSALAPPSQPLSSPAVEPESPLSDVGEFPRKVSEDLQSPGVPVERLFIPERPSIQQNMADDASKFATPISYDGDEYGQSDCDSEPEIVVHHYSPIRPAPTAVAATSEVPPLPNFDAAPTPAVVPDEFQPDLTQTSETSPAHEAEEESEVCTTPEPTTPRLTSTFDLQPLALSLDLDETDSLGLEAYMTPEKRPETPITSRTVAPPSPTKPTASKLDQWTSSEDADEAAANPRGEREHATITSRGVKLRTRPSLAPAASQQLASRRRQVSADLEASVSDEDAIIGRVRHGSVTASITPTDELPEMMAAQSTAVRSHSAPVLQPVLTPLPSEMSFDDINKAFDTVMQKQKRGYVVRQQSRIVHAKFDPDDEEVKPAAAVGRAASPTKGHTRQSSSVYTTASAASTKSRASENYNAHRRQGSRVPVGITGTPRMAGAATPIQSANLLDGGRLFVKVVQVKNLTLPVPKGEESFFCCTLDNGKHCVTTPWHTLATEAKIQQEFELIADADLEFILTLQAKYEPPIVPKKAPTTLGRLLQSPRKHKVTGSVTSLSLAGYVAADGSFARAYLALSTFADKAFGRPHTLVVPVLNEWALEATGSTSSSKGTPTRRRKPYKIGEIELQLLYVPPVDANDLPSLPTSLGQAVRDLIDAEWHTKQSCAGFLSQQGGDCPYWRRRQFKLVGTKLTAYHSSTGHIRATINLAKATDVTYDVAQLSEPEVVIGKGSKLTRRKSGFAEREEGHLYVAEGFRLRFGNGEVIDFYADNAEEKRRWIEALKLVVEQPPVMKPWARIILEAESARA